MTNRLPDPVKRSDFNQLVKDEVDHLNWPEYARKLGVSDNSFNEKYSSSDGASYKDDILTMWNQQAGAYSKNLQDIVFGVAREVATQERDAEIEDLFKTLNPKLLEVRNMAFFIYDFIGQYNDSDYWRREVVTRALTVDPNRSYCIVQDFKGNKAEEMYNVMQHWKTRERLKTVQEMVHKLRVLSLTIPPPYDDKYPANQPESETLDPYDNR